MWGGYLLMQDSIVLISHLRKLRRNPHLDYLMSLCRTHNVAIFPHTHILANNDIKWFAEILCNLIDSLIANALIPIINIWSTDASRVPCFRETWADDALTVECIRLYAEEPLYQRAGRNAYTVSEVAVALTAGSIILAYLSEIGWRLAKIHLVKNVGLHQSECFFRAPCLIIGKRGMHDFCGSYIVNTPCIRHPVGGGDSLVFS